MDVTTALNELLVNLEEGSAEVAKVAKELSGPLAKRLRAALVVVYGELLPEQVTIEVPEDLHALKVAELRALAARYDVPCPRSLRHDELAEYLADELNKREIYNALADLRDRTLAALPKKLRQRYAPPTEDNGKTPEA